MTAGEPSYLDLYLGPLAPFLADPSVTDLYVNRPGELWVERHGAVPACVALPALTDAWLWRLARQVASLSHQGVSRAQPLLGATLPDGTRIQIVAPSATRGTMALAMRRHRAARMRLHDYAAAGAFAAVSCAADADGDGRLAALYDAGDWPEFLAAAVRQRRTILVSGGTASGKTTFVNALIEEIDPDERLVLIEDAPELSAPHRNQVGLLAARGPATEAGVTADDLLVAALRLRPDRIILGELRGAEAFAFLRAINTGHPGSISTIHADTPERALEQLALMVVQARVGLGSAEVVRYARRIVDVIVQLERHGGRRRVAAVRWLGRDRASPDTGPFQDDRKSSKME